MRQWVRYFGGWELPHRQGLGDNGRGSGSIRRQWETTGSVTFGLGMTTWAGLGGQWKGLGEHLETMGDNELPLGQGSGDNGRGSGDMGRQWETMGWVTFRLGITTRAGLGRQWEELGKYQETMGDNGFDYFLVRNHFSNSFTNEVRKSI